MGNPSQIADEKSDTKGGTISRVLSVAVLVAGLATVIVALYIGVRSYTPVWFGDEWQVPIEYKALGDHYPVWKFWAQHNEHRIPFMKALQLVDLFWFKADHRFLLVLNWLIQAAQFFAAMLFLKRLGAFTKEELTTLAGITAFFVFNPNQMQNFEWAFQAAFLAAFFFALVALGAVATYGSCLQGSPGQKGCSKFLAIAIAAAFLAECNLASGVLAWLMMPVCGILLGMQRRKVFILCGAGVLGIAVYLVGYRSPPNFTNPLHALRNPSQVLALVVACFAESWHTLGTAVGTVLVIVAFLGVAYISVRLVTGGKSVAPVQAFALSLVWMMLLTGLITALGRQESGVQQVREGRYQTAAMLFWWGIAVVLVANVRKLGQFRRYALVALQLAFLGAFVAEARAFPALVQRYVMDGYIRSTAGLALEAGIYDEDMIRAIYPAPWAVLQTYSHLVENRLITPPFPEYRNLGKNVNEVYSILPPGSCVGWTDSIRRTGPTGGQESLFANGWGYYSAGRQAFRRVLATTPEGVIVGVGVSGGDRPDVAKVYPQMDSENTGWQLYAVADASLKVLAVYGVTPGANQACLLSAANEIPEKEPVPPPLPSSITDTLSGCICTLNGVAIPKLNDPHEPVHLRRLEGAVVEGWIVSQNTQTVMDDVYGVYADGRVVAQIIDRPDVASRFHNEASRRSGYRIGFPGGTLGTGLQAIEVVGRTRADGRYYKFPAVLYVYID